MAEDGEKGFRHGGTPSGIPDRKPWRIRYDGDEWTHETVTLGELAYAERITGTPGPRFDPVGHSGHLVALLIAHLHKAQGMPLADAVKRAEAITAAEFDDLVEVPDGNDE